MRFLSVLISLQVATVAVLLSAGSAQSGIVPQWPAQYATSIKNYLVELVKDNVIDKSRMMSSFQDTMATIKNRYESEKQSLGATANDAEQQALYYKIVVDELRNLRVRISKEPGKDAGKIDGLDGFKPPEGIKIVPTDEEIVDPALDGEEERELLNQLDELETLENNESEMGWSMDAEQRRKLGERTKRVLTDLMQNELRQLAMAIITSYMSGNPLAPVVTALAGSIRFKMVEYLMNIIMDVLANLMGRRPEIQPIPSPDQVSVPASA